MRCALCHQSIDLFDLDAEGVGGAPAHESCATSYRAEVAAALAEAEAMVLAETDPTRHRRHEARPAA